RSAPLPKICGRTRADDPEISPGKSRNRWRRLHSVSPDLDTATNGRPGRIVGYQKGVALLSDEGQHRLSGIACATLESPTEMMSPSNFYKLRIGRHFSESHKSTRGSAPVSGPHLCRLGAGWRARRVHRKPQLDDPRMHETETARHSRSPTPFRRCT